MRGQGSLAAERSRVDNAGCTGYGLTMPVAQGMGSAQGKSKAIGASETWAALRNARARNLPNLVQNSSAGATADAALLIK